MSRTIILDTFPLSSTGKREPRPGCSLTVLDHCREWIRECVAAGHPVFAPAIAYYEALRELERLQAVSQIGRLHAFCRAVPGRYLSITDAHLELAARLWGQARNLGAATASPEALDGDVILAAQVLSLGLPSSQYVVATTNVGHLAQFINAELWADVLP